MRDRRGGGAGWSGSAAGLAPALLALAASAFPADAQTRGGVLRLARVERKHPAMSVIHTGSG